MKYFFATINEVCGEHEFPTNFLMKLEPDDNPVTYLINIAQSFRGKGRIDEEGNIWFGSDLVIQSYNQRQISREDYKVLAKYLATL